MLYFSLGRTMAKTVTEKVNFSESALDLDFIVNCSLATLTLLSSSCEKRSPVDYSSIKINGVK